MEETVSKARKEWSEEHSCCNQTDVNEQIATARREWIKEHNDELEKRLSNAIEEVRRMWDEEQQLKTKEVKTLNKYEFLGHSLPTPPLTKRITKDKMLG